MDTSKLDAGTPDPDAAGEPPRFLVDAMLGRLARWLRLLGYDAEFAGEAADAEIVRRARSEGRVILTRDRDLARRRDVRTLVINGERLPGQLAQVTGAFPAAPERRPVRCVACNVALRALPGDDARRRVPPHVGRAHDEFQECPQCRRVFWRGTHWRAIAERLSAAADGGPQPSSPPAAAVP